MEKPFSLPTNNPIIPIPVPKTSSLPTTPTIAPTTNETSMNTIIIDSKQPVLDTPIFMLRSHSFTRINEQHWISSRSFDSDDSIISPGMQNRLSPSPQNMSSLRQRQRSFRAISPTDQRFREITPQQQLRANSHSHHDLHQLTMIERSNDDYDLDERRNEPK